MDGRHIPSPKSPSEPKPSSRPPSASKTMLIDNYIRRICIDSSADLGSLYDARIESKVGQLSLGKNVIIRVPQQKEIQCEIMKADMVDPKDIFQKVGIHEEPWLNSVLNIVPPEGMTALINYSFPKSSNTRFLYYYYTSEEKAISPTQNMVVSNISKVVPDTAATHAISAIKLGVQAFIVLQLSPDDEINLTRVLETTAEKLSKNKFQPSTDGKTLFEKIIVTKVFSNIPFLNNMSALAEICQKLNEIKPHVFRHLPLEFTLRTIKWFYPSYPNDKARYNPLESDVVKIINQYLLTLSNKIEELKTSLSSQDEQTLKERLHKQYDALQQQIVGVEKIYSDERERIRKLVIQIRSRITEQESIIKRLSEEFNESLRSNIDPIGEYLESLQKKLKLINKLDKNKIPYLDMQQYSIQQSDDLNKVFQKLGAEGKSELIFCSDDDLRDQNFDEWTEKCDNWMQEGINDSSLTLIYTDFTYASYHLSKIRILVIKSTNDVQNQSESSSLLPQTTAEPSSSVRERTFTEEQAPVDVNEQHEPSRSRPVSASQIMLESNDKSKGETVLPCPPPPPAQSPAKNTFTGTEQVSDAEEQFSSSRPIAPQPATRKSKQSTNSDGMNCSPRSENTPSSDEPGDLLKPPISPRTKQSSSDVKSPIASLQLLNSSTLGRASLPSQPHRSNMPDDVSSLPPLRTPYASQPLQKQSEDNGEQSKQLSSTMVQAPVAQSRKVEKPCGPPKLAELSDEERVSHENQLIKMNEKIKRANSAPVSISDTRQAADQLNGDNKESSNLSHSLTQSDKKRAPAPIGKIASLPDSTDLSRPSRPSSTLTTSRERRRVEKSVNQLNNTSNSPKIVSPRAAPHTKEAFTSSEGSSEPPTTNQPLPLENHSVSSIEQTNQPTSKEPSGAEHPDPSKEESNHEKAQNDSRPPTMKYVNILLLGESGVGKSTFINALVNYHVFENFEQARSHEPLVAMSVSFLMTIGDHFEEKIVRFGGIDPNEDHDHPGQSVTQQCRSYVFQIGTQTKLRLIDTPGMGDTRGLEQDDLNMEHILSFISNLPHLNAICILLKPNESRLNVVLRSYFTRLLNFLGDNARNHIVFCFTNTRATFYAPGDTGPLLRKMINSLPTKGIPFEKRNTFCFDSESFRYLVALQNGIQFDAYQEKEYEQSWKSSSITSISLIQYISEKLEPYKRNDWRSIEHAQFTINQLIRPILESTRNILRNITLLKEKSSTLLIKLRPVVLTQPSAICYRCPRTPKGISDFWILPDTLHTLSDTCSNCDCHRNKHIDISYSLEYELIEHEHMESFEKMKWDFDQLRKVIVDLSQFYAYVVDTLKQTDPLLSALKRIIAEEKQICSEKGPECLNSNLYDLFVGLTEEYNERRTTSISIHLPIDLPSVYELIDHIDNLGEVNEQMRAIKQTQKKYLRQYEKQVS